MFKGQFGRVDNRSFGRENGVYIIRRLKITPMRRKKSVSNPSMKYIKVESSRLKS